MSSRTAAASATTWRVQLFHSGTQIVTRLDPHRPHYYVYGPREDVDERLRLKTTYDLCAWLNGGPAPAWLGGLVRDPTGKAAVEDLDGRRIFATGPMVPAPGTTPADGNWIEDESDDVAAERRYMADCLAKGVRP